MQPRELSAAKPLCGANWPTPCEDCVGSCGIEEYIEEQEARSAATDTRTEAMKMRGTPEDAALVRKLLDEWAVSDDTFDLYQWAEEVTRLVEGLPDGR